ncbi:MAG: transcription antitermination factor NusB [Myxococcota bacterium]|nr:transcription antitermination factor NusB [Myxococcota bacterium]
MEDPQSSSSRRRAREVALQVLYAVDLGRWRSPASREVDASPEPRESDPAGMFDAVAESFEMPSAARDFARELVTEVEGHRAELDRSISQYSANWRIERMAAVDRNILRLGTYELLHTATPVGVILNEAVDLARRFSNDPSPAFVNGILDALARGVRDCEA